MASRINQVAEEVVFKGANVRVAQVAEEVVFKGANVRVAQVCAEVVFIPVANRARSRTFMTGV
jgi:hypothetical protein